MYKNNSIKYYVCLKGLVPFPGLFSEHDNNAFILIHKTDNPDKTF